MSDPLLEVLQDDGWLQRLFQHREPAARAFQRWLTHEVLPAVVRGKKFIDDGTMSRLTADLFIEVPALRPQPISSNPNQEGETK